jgi:hypothetical protein
MIRLLLIVLFSIVFSIAAFSQVVINEFSASNYDSFQDNYGEYEDWIELYNTTIEDIDLGGYYLSDRKNNPTKWSFPAGLIIAPHSFLRVWASGRDLVEGQNIHTNFKIKQTSNKEDVVLADPGGTIIDINEIPSTTKKAYSWARNIDGAGEWRISNSPSPGTPNGGFIEGYAEKPNIKPIAGFYAGSLEVTIEVDDPDVEVFYTLDGSTPDNTDILYTGPFMVTATTVVRSVSIKNDPGYEVSFTETNTYFIDETHTVKVISIVGDELPALLNGTYSSPVGSFEYFNEKNEKVDEAVGDYNKHGNDSWAYAQRGIDYICRDEYGYDSDIDDEIFAVSDRSEFQRLILKAAANDNYPFQNGSAHIRDAYVHTLSQLANLEMDERSYEPCVVYLNGEYWGVYELREKVDDPDFTEYYYDQDKYDIDFIKTWGGTWQEYGSWDDWYDVKDFIENNDMADSDNYKYVTDRFELLSLIDYIILHSYNVSSDWLNWNTAWWRGRNPNGGATKWRYALWDEDATYGHYINYSGIPDQSPFADPCNPEEINPDNVDFEGHVAAFKKLFDNPEFLSLYINRYADLNNTYFSCDYAIALLDSLIGNIAPEMGRHIDKWGGTENEWKENIEEMKQFILDRCTIIDQGIVDCYEDEGITGPYAVVIEVDPEGAGNVKANTIIGLSYPWNATYFGGVPLTLNAIPIGNNDFYGWETKFNPFTPDPAALQINMDLTSGDTIIAHFEPYLPCQGPSELLVDPYPGGVDLEWLGSETLVGYNVFYRKLGEVDWEIFSVVENIMFLDDLDPCTTYEIKIRTVCNKIVSEFSEFTFESYCSTATDNDLAELGLNELKLYPNPFNESFTIELDLEKSASMAIDLFSAQGQWIKGLFNGTIQSGSSSLSINGLEQLAPGSYLIRFANDQSSRMMLLIKS